MINDAFQYRVLQKPFKYIMGCFCVKFRWSLVDIISKLVLFSI